MKQIETAKEDYKTTKNDIKKFNEELTSYHSKIKAIKKEVKNDISQLSKFSQFPSLNLKDELENILKSYLMQEYGSVVTSFNKWRSRIPLEVREQITKKLLKKNKKLYKTK